MNARRTIAVVLAIAALSLSGCAIFDPQSNLTLNDVMNSEYDAPDVTTEVMEITDAACGSALDCVEAYSTAEADYFRFDSRERAEEYGATLDDGFVINFIVMDFEGKDASVEHQLWAMQSVAGTWNDYEGEFPDR
jgi:osmotically inducible lipoprotein OsmE